MASVSKIVILVVLLAACGVGPLCVTRCGLRFQGVIDDSAPPAGWTCDALQDQEDSALEAFAVVTDPEFANACRNLKDYDVWLHTEQLEYKSSYTGAMVAGETWCWGNRWILLPQVAQPKLGGMSHEMAHVVQNCEPADHSNWDQYGIWQAVEKAQEP